MGAWDKIYAWVFNIGRYLIILVEVVVLIAFVTRFSLDRKKNDLEEKIKVKVHMLKAQTKVEAELRSVQSALTSFSLLIDDQNIMSTRVSKILDLIPEEMELQTFSINTDRISLQLLSPSYEVAHKFEESLRTDKDYGDVKVSVESEGAGASVQFSVTVNFSGEKEQ